VVVLALVCLLMRLPHLTALPIFGDEAIYLRWAQVIRGEGLGGSEAGAFHPWVSLADPKPPLHFWLISLVYHWTADPLEIARTLSVWAGVLSVALIYLLCAELGDLVREPRRWGREGRDALPWYATGRVTGILAALLLIFCPFLAFYHRLATADALFAAESLAIAWLSLRWARLATTPGSRGRAWMTAVFLGVAIGAALMTRQGLSYTMSFLPAIAWAVRWFTTPDEDHSSFTTANSPQSAAPRPGRRPLLLGSIAQLATAAVIAAALWAPYLGAELSPRALEHKRDRLQDRTIATATTSDLFAEVKRRILYQDQFTEAPSRLATATRNFRLTFIPSTNARGAMDSGWFFYYLTPAVYLAALAGFVYLAARRQWRVLLLLLAWAALAMGPVVLLANVIFSRYVLAGVPPFLVAAAFFVGDLLGILFTKYERKPAIPWLTTAFLFFALLFPSLIELGRQAAHWPAQTLTARDNYQYISGWPAGRASQRAVSWLLETASAGKLIVITDNGWGTPADALWVYLSGRENIQLYYTDRGRILDPTEGPPGGEAWLRPNKWLFPPYEKVAFPPDVPILYVASESGGPAIDRLREKNPGIKPLITFKGVANPRTGESDPDGAVTIFQLPRPAQ
jgi:4-amino-4-deoxy-L-arabinose transferase-like glycosyltransferase